MTAAVAPDGLGFEAKYRADLADVPPVPGAAGIDELFGPDGVRPAYEGLTEVIDGMGTAGLRAASAEAARFVADEGMTYGGERDGRPAARWGIDPLPMIIEAADWARLVAGLEQRAELLDALLGDIYGRRTLLQQGVIPPEVIVGHPEFVWQADQIRLKGPRQLVLTATDLANTADGWVVLSDRSQAPSGAGYVMGTRRIVARTMAPLHQRTGLNLLRDFYRTMSSALQDVARTTAELPRVVVYSPGAGSETAFDQAFTATLLGFPLVQADDLEMREGRVWISEGNNREPVDVILRRVDAAFCDPLDLRSDSQLGLPGMIEAARQGHVTIVNPIGSGILENTALATFLPAVSRHILGEDLRLPTVETWWCGDPKSLSHVAANLETLVIKPTTRSHLHRTRLGWDLSEAERADLLAQIRANPGGWVAEAAVAASTSPVVTRSGPVPRRTVLRTFGVGHDAGYRFLPGGLARVAGPKHPYLVTNAAGAIAKDVWVLASEPVTDAGEPPTPRPWAAHRPAVLAPRVADNLYWLGRYANRAENTIRALAATEDLARDHYARGTGGSGVMQTMLDVFGTLTGRGGADQHPLAGLHSALVDDRVGSVAHSVRKVSEAASHVRDILSGDTWSMLSRLDRTLDEARETGEFQPALQKLLESLLAWSGIMAESMVRDATYGFLDAGARIERAQFTVALLRAAFVEGQSFRNEARVAESVLRVGESSITYRRRLAAGMYPGRPSVAAQDLLLVDATNPRSVKAQLEILVADLRLVDDDVLADKVAAAHDALRSWSNQAYTSEALGALETRLRDINDAIGERHFTRHSPQRTLQPGWNTPWQVV